METLNPTLAGEGGLRGSLQVRRREHANSLTGLGYTFYVLGF